MRRRHVARRTCVRGTLCVRCTRACNSRKCLAMTNAGATTRARGGYLSLDAIVRTTIDLLDRSGVEAFSMRTLANELGVSTMAAYRHVENREALLRLAAEGLVDDVPDVGP